MKEGVKTMKKLSKCIMYILLLSNFLFSKDDDYIENPIQTAGIALNYIRSIYNAEGEIRSLPLLNLRLNRFFLRGSLELGYIFYEEPMFKFSLIVNPLYGYFDGWTIKSKKMKDGYRNIDNRKAFPVGGVSLDAFLTDEIFTNLTYQIGKNGSKAEITFGTIFRIFDRFTIIPSISGKIMDKKFTNHFIGITEQEVIKNAKIKESYKGRTSFSGASNISLECAINDNFAATIFSGIEIVDDKIKKSPIVKINTQLYGGLGLRVTF